MAINKKNRQGKTGEMAINAAFVVVVAIIAVILFLLVIFAKFPALSKSIYCKTLSPLKTMFSPSSGSAEESYCRQNEILQNSTIRMEKVVQRTFADGNAAELIKVQAGQNYEIGIPAPKANITLSSFRAIGYSEGFSGNFADGSSSETFDFSEGRQKEIALKIPKEAYVVNATMELFSSQEEELAEVLLFTGYSHSCGFQYGNGMFDDARKYLYYHMINYDESKCWKGDPDWKNKLANHSILIVGSGLNLTANNDEDREYIRQWIAQGNSLIATGWALNLLISLFGEAPFDSTDSTAYFTRITPYQKCPGLISPSTTDAGSDSGASGRIPNQPNSNQNSGLECNATIPKNCNDPSIVPCRETVGYAGLCGDSQRIIFTSTAEAEYDARANKVYSVIYSNTPCIEANSSNQDVKIIADLVYNISAPSPLDKDLTRKCADKNYGRPGQSIIEFNYGNGSVLYLAPNIQDQLGSDFGETNFLASAIIARMKKSSIVQISSCNSRQPDWQSSGSFRRGRTAVLSAEKINSFLSACTPDSEGNCAIPVRINARIINAEPLLTFHTLSISYMMPLYRVNITSGGEQLAYFDKISPYDAPWEINASRAVSAASKCPQQECTAFFNVSAGSNGFIALSGLETEYRQCAIKNEIMAEAVACWERSGLGKSSSDIKCYELSIPESCTSVENLNESSLTDAMLNESDLCEVLGNNDANPECGRYNQIDWNIVKAVPGRNILIEYSSKKGRIIIS